jgi:hypothetical protein
MTLSDASLDEFIEIYAQEFDERLTREEARPIATNLVNFFRLMLKLPPKEIAQSDTAKYARASPQ